MAELTSSADIFRFPRASCDWTQQELSEFYRVENALGQAGLRVSCDRGLSDEGDPWFVFYRETDHEPLVHFARIDGYYIIASAVYDGIARGKNFREMILDLLDRHCLKKEKVPRKSNVFFHPAALLITLVGVAFFKSPSSSKADETDQTGLENNNKGDLVTSKGKISESQSSANNSRGPSTATATSEWTEEMTNILMLAITELNTITPAASAEFSNSTLHHQYTDSVFQNTQLQLSKSKDLEHKDQIKEASDIQEPEISNTISFSDSIIQFEKASDTLKSDVHALFNLLNDVPISELPNNLPAFSSLSNKTTPHVSPLKMVTNQLNSADNHSLNNSLNLITESPKLNNSTATSSEKDANANTLEQSKLRSESLHNMDVSSNSNSTPTTLSNHAMNSEVEYKISLNSAAPSALAIIKQLDQAFHFINEKGISLTITVNQGNSLELPQPVKSTISTSNANSSTSNDTANNYSFTVVENAIQPIHDITHQSLNSNYWSGVDIEDLIGKFLKTFTNSSFISGEHDSFIFKTSASLSSAEQLELISINFQDGSNINIIGQKFEIDGLLSHS